MRIISDIDAEKNYKKDIETLHKAPPPLYVFGSNTFSISIILKSHSNEEIEIKHISNVICIHIPQFISPTVLPWF